MNGVERKLARIEESLDRIELGKYADLSLSYCADYITWCAEFRKVPKSVWGPICERITRIFEERTARLRLEEQIAQSRRGF